MNFNIEKIPSQAGKIAVVTGANIGLGFETAMALAKKEATVIMACRNLEKAETAKTKILKIYPNAKLDVMPLDLSKLASVRAFAAAFTKKYTQLDLLINNAGIMMPPFSLTEDGFESQLGTNYVGHFLLTKLLFPLLKESPKARVVSLSSLAHRWHSIQFEDINFNQKYSARNAYSQSKLACLIFAIEFDKRLKESGLNILSVAAHPGVSDTNLSSSMPKVIHFLATTLGSFFTQSAKDGAEPTLYAALGTDIIGGDYTGPDGKGELKGKATKVKPRSTAKNAEVGKRLWEMTEEMIGEKFEV